jgi:hypothetical protein
MVQQPRYLVKVSGDGEPIEFRGHGIASPEPIGRSRQAHLREGSGRSRNRGVGPRGRVLEHSKRRAARRSARRLRSRHVRGLFGEAVATRAQVPEGTTR